MKFKIIAPNIYWIDFNSQYQLASTFLRFQEHYESPEFKDKVFTLGQYREWYKTTRTHGEFSYYRDWDGFNIPSYVFKPFINGLFDPLTAEEQELMFLLMRSGVDLENNFYLVGTHSGEIDVLDHEICHALYYTNPNYREHQDRLMAAYDLTDLHKVLMDMGYHRDLCKDEAQAYICTGFEESKGMSCPEQLKKAMISVKDIYFPVIARS
jgi:hypothetical protein